MQNNSLFGEISKQSTNINILDPDEMRLLRRCIAEFIGTFAIVFGGCGAIAVNEISQGAISHFGIATTFGLIVMTMVYATGHISGAHLNPAVTIAFSLTRHFPKMEIIPYLISQFAGAVTASLIHAYTLFHFVLKSGMSQTLNLGVTLPIDNQFSTAFVWEIILTFFLMFVIMAVATDYRAVGKAAGLAIGGVVWFDALFAGPICGASMNPARSFGPAVVSGNWDHLFAYLSGPIIGAILGAFVYEFIRGYPNDKKQINGES